MKYNWINLLFYINPPVFACIGKLGDQSLVHLPCNLDGFHLQNNDHLIQTLIQYFQCMVIWYTLKSWQNIFFYFNIYQYMVWQNLVRFNKLHSSLLILIALYQSFVYMLKIVNVDTIMVVDISVAKHFTILVNRQLFHAKIFAFNTKALTCASRIRTLHASVSYGNASIRLSAFFNLSGI